VDAEGVLVGEGTPADCFQRFVTDPNGVIVQFVEWVAQVTPEQAG